MIEPASARACGYQLVKLETHLHSVHSDGQDSVAAMFEAAQRAGYQAVALTDHNTTSGLPEAHAVASELGLILVPGVEVTTFRGHAVVLGVSETPEWRDLEARGMDALIKDVHRRGGLVTIAHPVRMGSPLCSGCAWQWPVAPDGVDLWEVFSVPNPAWPHPETSLALWRAQVARGLRAAPVAAGDVHSAAAAAAERAATFVYVRERTTEGVLDGLRHGRLVASRGQQLELVLQDGLRQALPGEHVAPGAWVARTSPGAVVSEVATPGGRCIYAEVRDEAGGLVAVTAPIWIETEHADETSV